MSDIRNTQNWSFETKQIHIGQEKADPATGARAVPIYASACHILGAAIIASFHQHYFFSRVCQHICRRQSGQAAADNDTIKSLFRHIPNSLICFNKNGNS